MTSPFQRVQDETFYDANSNVTFSSQFNGGAAYIDSSYQYGEFRVHHT